MTKTRKEKESRVLLELYRQGEQIALADPKSKDISYLARGLHNLILPRSKPKSERIEIQNGDLNVVIVALDKKIGLPYGSYPRLIRYYIEDQVYKKHKNNEEEPQKVYFGRSAREFFELLGIPWGGKSAKILRKQGEAFIKSQVFIQKTFERFEGSVGLKIDITKGDYVWLWSRSDPEQQALFENYIKVSDEYFKEITSRPLPIDMRVVSSLKRWAMALDIYMFLTARLFSLQKRTLIPWGQLSLQFGGHEFERDRKFREEFKINLKRVQKICIDTRLKLTENGLSIDPTLPTVKPKKKIKAKIS
ncbi:MAG: hypothetical protein JXQ65_07685 [Candidatus Marinimicrobia bacterium]|nr:hypothetical protein [Candidatus Neomarinimicrobiota bacterium]